MKVFLLFALFLSALLPSLASAEIELFTRNEEKEILTLIDNRCGDTWCEGDYNYDFKEFSCYTYGKTTECKLSFVMSYTEYLEEKKHYQATFDKAFPVSCTFTGLKKKSDVLMADRKHSDLSDAFTEKLNDCIADLEDALRKFL